MVRYGHGTGHPLVNLRPQQRPPPRAVELHRAERELFFWTARQWLRLIVSLALTVYLVVSLIEGLIFGDDVLIRLLRDLMELLS